MMVSPVLVIAIGLLFLLSTLVVVWWVLKKGNAIRSQPCRYCGQRIPYVAAACPFCGQKRDAD